MKISPSKLKALEDGQMTKLESDILNDFLSLLAHDSLNEIILEKARELKKDIESLEYRERKGRPVL